MNALSPSGNTLNRDKNWTKFGFEVQYEPGYDYSWIFIQGHLDLLGVVDSFYDCELFYSSRRPDTFLVEHPSKDPSLWTVTNLKFDYYYNSRSLIKAYTKDEFFLLSGVTLNLIRLLLNISKFVVRPRVHDPEMYPIKISYPTQFRIEVKSVPERYEAIVRCKEFGDEFAEGFTIKDDFFILDKPRYCFDFSDLIRYEVNKEDIKLVFGNIEIFVEPTDGFPMDGLLAKIRDKFTV